jgi:hypothetical protein
MLMWINLITQESHIRSEVSDVISRKLSTPSPSETPTEQNGSKQATPEFKSISPWVASAFQIFLRLLDPLQDYVTITLFIQTSL